jgi:hypothetical protein
MKRNDMVKTVYGKIEKIMNADDIQVTTYESASVGNWYHPTKVFPVYWSETLGQYVTIPEVQR